MKSDTTISCSPTLVFVTFLVFMALKMAGVITWKWVYVLSPLWAPLALFLGIALIIIIAKVIVELVD